MTVQEQLKDGTVIELEPRPPEYSDDALALLFADQHHEKLKYVAVWSKWMIWAGTHWQTDNTMHVYSLARGVCRLASAKCNKDRVSTAIASAKTVAAVLSLSRADRRIAATVDQWDNDPWLLNTPGGVVDLRNGDTSPHRPQDYMTLITAVDKGPASSTWRKFLARVTDGDEELQAYLRRVAGYALTGSIREHSLFFLYGTGSNGKSVFVNALSDALGDYHKTAPMEAFTTTHSDRHPTELAGLLGARLVTAVETEEGRRWAESRIKSLTGGDAISARFMRQDFFEFTPQFKLMIAGNHKPGIRNVDEAMRRRLHLIPFTVTIPEGERDETLPDRIKEELGGVLTWMIEGAIEWSDEGLRRPEAVRDATDQYLEAEDAFARWIEDCCTEGPVYTTITSELFGSYKAWCDRTGEYAGPMKRFSQNLETRGFERWQHPDNRRHGFRGLQIVKVEEEIPWTQR